jgi:FAD/FMN-containing dehydrogenase
MSFTPSIITDADILAGHLTDQSGLRGTARGVVRARDLQDVVGLMQEASAHGIPVLPIGCQTATTGAAVPQDDLLLDLRQLSGVVDIDEAQQLVEVLPGTITRDLKDTVAAAGLYYPPDPTSEWESTVGGNVATNASGARSFRWGMTADWIAGLEVVLSTGAVHRFMRRFVDKNTAGYRPFLDPVDLFLGSEGTLGVVTRIWCRLLRDPGPSVGFLLFLGSLPEALSLAVAFRQRRATPTPRCCELLDSEALTLLATHPQAPSIPAAGAAALYVEFDGGMDVAGVVERAVLPLVDHGVLVDETVIAQTPQEREWLRTLRHYIPEQCNLAAARFHGAGGLKVSTEFCVPIDRLQEMMAFVETTAREASPGPMVRYGHIGNGHPHIFMRGENRAHLAACRQLAHRWYSKAVALGGTVSGEHGIGKTRRDILSHMYPREIILAMRKTKAAMDPSNILGRGNIFAP